MDNHDETKMTHFGFMNVSIAEKQGLIDGVFHRVAGQYDLMNDLMSGGLHRLWKDAAVAWLSPPKKGYRLLDVAGGTGDIAFRVHDICEDADIVLLDINADMLKYGQCKSRATGRQGLSFVQGNGQELPFEDGCFDAITVAFGVRNMTHIDKALGEMFRVLRYGGRFICLEFSCVNIPLLNKLYDFYSFNVIPLMGKVISGNADSYRYLVESIRKFPDQELFASMIGHAGFEMVSYRDLSGGIAAIHSGWRL